DQLVLVAGNALLDALPGEVDGHAVILGVGYPCVRSAVLADRHVGGDHHVASTDPAQFLEQLVNRLALGGLELGIRDLVQWGTGNPGGPVKRVGLGVGHLSCPYSVGRGWAVLAPVSET